MRHILVLLVLVLASAGAQAQTLKFNNTSKYLGKENWEWFLYLDSPPAVLDSIDSVTYQLHWTFKERTVKVDRTGQGDRTRRFGITRVGWGTFPVKILVRHKDGRKTPYTHSLVFRFDRANLPQGSSFRVVELSKSIAKSKKHEYTVGIAPSSLPPGTSFVQYVIDVDDEHDDPAEIFSAGNSLQMIYAYRFKARPGTDILVRVFLNDGRYIDARHKLSQ